MGWRACYNYLKGRLRRFLGHYGFSFGHLCLGALLFTVLVLLGFLFLSLLGVLVLGSGLQESDSLSCLLVLYRRTDPFFDRDGKVLAGFSFWW